ncbi:hypothetical protein ACMX2H_13075 [Arthrobacter sulfonylureivorans]|uniref:hypothetical protein n=1 Tax=Arthrobacter sulfonylureivorans TaxID=2486855 RepID=UPI0039E71294
MVVAADGYVLYEYIVAVAHIAFVAFLLGSGLGNLFRFPSFLYGDNPKPWVQRSVGIGELVVALVLSLPYFWGEGTVFTIAAALAYAGVIAVVAVSRWRRGHIFRPAYLLIPALLALALSALKAGELAAFIPDIQA